MRISDWSSDVCSSDLAGAGGLGRDGERGAELRRGADHILEGQGGRDLLGQRAQLALAMFAVQRGVERGEQPFGRDRLGEIVGGAGPRSEEHTSELQSLMRISYAVFCLKQKKKRQKL